MELVLPASDTQEQITILSSRQVSHIRSTSEREGNFTGSLQKRKWMSSEWPIVHHHLPALSLLLLSPLLPPSTHSEKNSRSDLSVVGMEGIRAEIGRREEWKGNPG